MAVGKTAEAAKWFERAVAVRPEDFATHMLLSNALEALGRTDDRTRAMRKGFDAARRHLELNPDNPRALYFGAIALSGLGESDRARDWNRRALKMEPDDPSVLYNIACVFARENMPDDAVATLTKAIDNGFGHWQWIEHDADFESIRNNPGFVALLARKPATSLAT
jgi:Flp pilus assembly protein TadD